MYIAFACPPVESSPAVAVVLPGFFAVEESRYVSSSGCHWEKAMPLLRNKLLRPALLSVDGCSGAIGSGRGKMETSRSGSVAVASPPVLGAFRLGIGCLAILPSLVRLLPAGCREMVVLFVVCWLIADRQVMQDHGQRSTGRVPGRRSFSVKIYCGSNQSLQAMVLLLAMVLVFFLICCCHGCWWWWKMTSDGVKHRGLGGPFCNFSFHRVFCASCVGQLFFLHPWGCLVREVWGEKFL